MKTEFLERNKNNEANFKRLDIGFGGREVGDVKQSSGMSVVETLFVQIFLGVEQFSDEVRFFGVVD